MKHTITTAAVCLLLVTGAASAAEKSVLPWIADDYAAALAQARQKQLPIFVDMWAPW